MAIIGLKVAILDFKMAMELSENIFIWTAAINCTSTLTMVSSILLYCSLPSCLSNIKKVLKWPFLA